VAAVASFRNDIDILLEAQQDGADGDALDRSSIGVVAARVGLSVPTLQRLHELSEEVGAEPLTTRDIADHFGIQQRTARRMLQRLELAGVAERSGSRSAGGSGRPLTLYRLRL
jgi:predicted ArsR family transcriptional regulator